jgi:hypothetical protein
MKRIVRLYFVKLPVFVKKISPEESAGQCRLTLCFRKGLGWKTFLSDLHKHDILVLLKFFPDPAAGRHSADYRRNHHPLKAVGSRRTA